MKQVYLGDGAYAEYDDYMDLVIYTSNGITKTNTIYLDKYSVSTLLAFIKENK